MIYVPNLNSNNCVVLTNSTTLRVYEYRPTQNSTRNYTEYYLNMHYYSNVGTATFGNTSYLPICRTDVTSDVFYRVDMPDILTMFFILSIFCFYIPLKLFTRFSRRTQ